MLPGLCKLGFASNSANPLFGSLSGARLRANGIFPFLPHLSCRASQAGAEKTLEVSEDSDCLRAKPEFFSVPPSARSKGSPQGQGWLGCLFLVSSFGHAKEERKQQQKVFFRIFPGIAGRTQKSPFRPWRIGSDKGVRCLSTD